MSPGHKYAGVQYGNQCYCGNSFGKYDTADNCDMACSGDESQMCGGTWANMIYGTGLECEYTMAVVTIFRQAFMAIFRFFTYIMCMLRGMLAGEKGSVNYGKKYS